MSIFAEVRRWFPLKAGKGDLEVRATHLESLAVDQVAPAALERARAGRMFQWGPQNGVTGIAPVAALPTTAAQWTIWNADQNCALVFEELGVLLASGTAAAGVVLLVAPFQLPTTTGAQATGMAITNCSTRSKIGSLALFKSGVTITQPTAPVWYPAAKSDSANTAVLSVAAENRAIQGALIVPPQTGLGFVVLSGAGTTPLFCPFGKHFEVELDLE